MSTRDKLKELIRNLIRQEMEEASMTGNLDGGAGPPKTPYMFQSKPKSKKDKDLRLLAYQILVDKFNSKYKSLNESQKDLLKNYINNISNTNSLREFVDNEVLKTKTELKKHLPKVSDKITKIKLSEAINQINTISKGKVVTEKQVLNLMRYYELVKEIKNVHKR